MAGGILARGVFAAFVSVFVGAIAHAELKSGSVCSLEVAAESERTPLSAFEASALDEIRSRDYAGTMGSIVSRYDRVLRTRLYYGASRPDANGEIPLVDPDAKAVLIYFHGSGTMKAGGRNLLNRMPSLMMAGVAPISLDLPFHSEGPLDSQFENLDYFMEWLHKLMRQVAASGKPIYMMGHSFGPFVIQEYCSRHPEMVKGALLLAAAGDYHPALTWTYRNVTTPGMKYIDETLEDASVNYAGGDWADAVQKGATWTQRATPKTEMIFLRGTEDEWFPENKWLTQRLHKENPHGPREVEDWLKTKYPQAKFIFKEGFGHYIFEAKGPKGGNLISETLYELMGIEGELQPRPHDERPATEQIAALYYNSPAFRTWAGQRYLHMIASEGRAARELQGWRAVQARNWLRILESMPEESPDFYNRRVVSWYKTLHSARKRASDPTAGFDSENQLFSSEYGHYLRSRADRIYYELGEDPQLPKLPPLGPNLLAQRAASKWGVQDVVRFEDLSAAVQKGNGKFNAILVHDDALPGGLSVYEVRYHVSNSPNEFTAYVVPNLSQEQYLKLLRSGFIAAASRIEYHTPKENWEGRVGNWKLSGITKSGKLEHVQLSPWSESPAQGSNTMENGQ